MVGSFRGKDRQKKNPYNKDSGSHPVRHIEKGMYLHEPAILGAKIDKKIYSI